MITKVTSVEELKQIFSETLLNHTDKISKISEGSVLNGIAYANAKLGQKILKDIAVIESHLFPDSATGEYLDNLAKLRGIAPRLGSSNSSVFVRLVGSPGTTYTTNSQVFSGGGFNFNLLEDVTIPSIGFCYVALNCEQTGESTNVSALSITQVNPKPAGHQYVINEFPANGGRNEEDDEDFRNRIKNEVNVISRGTLSYLEQVFKKFQPNVLRVFNLGLDISGDLVLSVSSVNGVNFTNSQLKDMLSKGEQYFSMNELKPNGLNNYGLKIKNVSYFPIDVSMRVEIDGSYNSDIVRKEIQINLSKVVDYRYWQDGDGIDWIDLINSVKSVQGVKRVLDNFFFPNTFTEIPRGRLPRLRGFSMMDLKGKIIADYQGNLKPLYYPNNNDFAYQATVLKSL